MGTIAVANSGQATGVGSGRRRDRTSNGVQWTAYATRDGSGNYGVNLAVSTDGGTTETVATSIDVVSGGASYHPTPVLFIDNSNSDDFAHLIFRSPGNGNIYYRRGTPNADRSAYTWSAAVTIKPDAGGSHPDLWVMPNPTTAGAWVAHVVMSSSAADCYYQRLDISAAGAVTVGSLTAISSSFTSGRSALPSIEVRNTGNGKTPTSQPDVFVAWSAGDAGSGKGIRCRQATYSGGTWTWGTEQQVDSTLFLQNDNYWVNCLHDGSRIVVTGFGISSGSATTSFLYDVNPATGDLTQRIKRTDWDAFAGSAAVTATGDVYRFGSDGGNPGSLRYRRFNRSTLSDEAQVVVDPTVATAYASTRRGTGGGRLDYVYTDGTANPYTLTSGRLLLNSAPNVGGKPSPDGVFLDRTAAQTFSYQFSDPDAGDTPSRTDWRWRTSPVSGTPGAWNTSTVTGTSTSITYPATTFPAGRIELQDLPYDSQGVVAPAWSDSAFIAAADPPTAVTFASPAAGSTIPSASVTATITTTNLDALVWEVRGDTAGTANATVIASGTIEDPTARSFTATGLANGTTVHLRARRRVNGLLSPWADNGAQLVSFTPPPAAVLTLTPVPATAKLAVGYAIPAPTGSEPAVTGVDIYVDDATVEGLRRITGTGAVDRSPTASPWVHDTPALGREYGAGSGRVVVVVKGANGTTRTTTS